MKLTHRLKQLRTQAGLSQLQVGASGVVSIPGYIKIENGQRTASEKMLGKLAVFLHCPNPPKRETAKAKEARLMVAGVLHQELLLLKLLNDKSHFTRKVAGVYAQSVGHGHLIEEISDASGTKPRSKKGVVKQPDNRRK